MINRDYDYAMDYIADKNLYKAVMWARKMRREGKPARDAIRIAARYYRVSDKDIAYYMGQVGGRTVKKK